MPIINNGTDNKIDFFCNDQNLVDKLDIKINGNRNKIKFLGKINGQGKIKINLIASDCSITLGRDIIISRGINISIIPAGGGFPATDCHVNINDRVLLNGVSNFLLAESGNTISIGADCIVGNNVNFLTSDSHPIYDLYTNKRLNHSSSIFIENKVWVANNVHFMKKSHIPSGSIIGAHSVVAKKFNKPNVVIAGNPARIIRKNVKWKLKFEPEDSVHCASISSKILLLLEYIKSNFKITRLHRN